MEARFFLGFSGEYVDFSSKDHLSVSNRFLCVELSNGDRMLVVGSSELAIHNMLWQALNKSGVCYKNIIGAGVLQDGFVTRWSSSSIMSKKVTTTSDVRQQILDILGTTENIQKRYVGHIQGDR